MSEQQPTYAEFVSTLAADPDTFASATTPYTLLARELEALNEHALPLDHLKRVITYGDKLRMELVQPNLISCESLRGRAERADIAHGLLGVITESMELIPILHRILNGGGIDKINLREELGDLKFYMQLAINAMDSTWEQVEASNRLKLQQRYDGVMFDATKALNRNLDAEREKLEEDV